MGTVTGLTAEKMLALLNTISGPYAEMTNALAIANPERYYFASDLNGGTIFVSNGATWDKASAGVLDVSGRELAYVEKADANYVYTPTNSNTDQTVLTLPVTVGVRPIVLFGCIPDLAHASTATLMHAKLMEGATILDFGVIRVDRAGGGEHVLLRSRLAPSPGVHTYTLVIRQAGSTGTGATITGLASANSPIYLQALEA